MRKLVLILVLAALGGCASFERELARDIVKSGEVKLDRCEVSGFRYPGIDNGLQTPKVLKVLMIHGVGIHHPGYSRRIQENLAAKTGLDVLSRLPKNIKLRDPENPQTPIGNLRISFWQNRSGTENMLFYELTWSEITTPEKQIIAFDTTEQYSKFRVPFNNMMKEFLDSTLPDPLLYLVGRDNLIRNSGRQALCWMLKTDWNSIPDNRAEVCTLGIGEEVRALGGQKLAFITHSLGSEILMDVMIDTANRIAPAIATPEHYGAETVRRLQNKEITMFMLANQLPILQIGRPLPPVHNQTGNYCRPSGQKYRRRIFKAANIVAFSDPNDILSYAIPQGFADKYIDSRICPQVTNVSVNVAPEISAFGVGIVNPVTAHTAYDNSPKVIGLITRGTDDFNQDKELSGFCRFIELRRDNQMRL